MGNRKNYCCFPGVEDDLAEDETFYCLRTYSGMVLLWGRKGARFPFGAQVGPDWYCTLITYTLIIIPSGAFILNVADDWGLGLIIPSSLLALALLVAFSFTACSNPGVAFRVPETEIDDIEGGQQGKEVTTQLLDCSKCNIKRPPTAYHCYDCGVCVNNLDHHCPWTGKCIGRDNIKYFHAFLTLLSAQIAFVVVMTIVSVATGKDIYN